MALAPPAFSPRWALALVVTAALWTGLVVLAAYVNTGDVPTLDDLRGAAPVLALLAGLPCLVGFFGGRLGFLGAQLGLLIGYLVMLRGFAGPGEGFQDLAGVATFLLLGALGLAAGVIADLVRYVLRERRA